MAGDWIKMRADLFTHPKVVRISSALKADTLKTVGALMSVWCLFDAHSTDGHLEGYSPDYLDSHLRWEGFAQAMVAVGWLVVNDESLELPSFDTHNGESAKRRAQDAERKRVARLSAAEADKDGTREEERREEKNITQSLTLVTGAKKPKRVRKSKPDEFAMTLDWSPSLEFEKNLPPNLITTPSLWIADLLEFCTYRKGTGELLTQSEWEHKYLQNLEANKKHRGQA